MKIYYINMSEKLNMVKTMKIINIRNFLREKEWV